MQYLRYNDLVAAGDVKNRMTLHRWIEAGLFPPPVDLGPNSVAWENSDVEERRRRVREGIRDPHPEWLARAAARKARDADGAAARRARAASGAAARKARAAERNETSTAA